MTPRSSAVFRLLGWLFVATAAGLAIVAALTLVGIRDMGGDDAGVAGILYLSGAALVGFAGAMLFGFAANLALLREIRDELRRQGARGGQGGS